MSEHNESRDALRSMENNELAAWRHQYREARAEADLWREKFNEVRRELDWWITRGGELATEVDAARAEADRLRERVAELERQREVPLGAGIVMDAPPRTRRP